MDTINLTDACDCVCIQVMTPQSRGHVAVSLWHAGGPFLSAAELGCDRSLWRPDSWRTDNQDWRHRHPGFDRRNSDFVDNCGDALSCRPGVVIGMGELKVIRSQHQDDKRQGRADLDALLQALEPISARFERILPD